MLLGTLGLPGAGKTHFSRLFAQKHGMYHLNSDKLRHDLFDSPTYSQEESEKVFEKMEVIAHKKLSQGIGVIFDSNATLKQYRDDLQAMAQKYDTQYCLLWFVSDDQWALQGIKQRRGIEEEELRQHHITLDEDVAKQVVASVGSKIQNPQDEPFIKLDAHLPYEELEPIVEQKLGFTPSKLKAIIFDWHGVLDMARLRHAMEKLADIVHVSGQEVRQRIADLTFPWNTGQISSDEFWTEVARRFDLGEDQINQIRIHTTTVHHNNDLWAWLPELKQKYKIAILSNSDIAKTKFIHNNEDLTIFDEVRFSSDSGMDKSQDEFFLELTRTLGVEPHEVMYVDDTVAHVEKAKSLGFHTCLFKETSDLRRDLKMIH